MLDQAKLQPVRQLQVLTEVNIQDFLKSFGLMHLRSGRKFLEALCQYPARRFARQMVAFDERVGSVGLHQAASQILPHYVRNLEISGRENLPETGPLLVLANHPGMTDTLIIFSTLPRQDLRIIAAQRPFLDALGNVSRYLINVPEETDQRMSVVRSTVSHLRRGGAIITFPAGKIEPDPASAPDALAALQHWSESVAIFARLVPELQIVTAIVSGVIWPAAMRHPLTHLRRRKKDQERLGASLQVLVQTLLPFYPLVRTRISYSKPLQARELLTKRDPSALMQAIRKQAQTLIMAINPEG